MARKNSNENKEDSKFWKATDTLRCHYAAKSEAERENEIIKIINGCREGVFPIYTAMLVSAVIDVKNFERIFNKHMPGSETYFAKIRASNANGHDQGHGNS